LVHQQRSPSYAAAIHNHPSFGFLAPYSKHSNPAASNAPVYESKLPLSTGRPRLVCLGTGWGGARLLHDIDPKLYDLTVISMRNHMVFTPLLSSTCVGTLEPQAVAVHITDIQPALFKPQNHVLISEALSVCSKTKQVEAVSDGIHFKVPYDKLVISTGSQGSTFGIPGVLEHTNFLRDLHQAEAIRSKLVDNISKAGIPGRPAKEKQTLLDIVIVGGGPTGVEVAGELTDFIEQDLKRMYPDRAKAMRVTIIEAKEILGTFDYSLREYAAQKMSKRGVRLHRGIVQKVEAGKLTLQDGEEFTFGLCIWSTGVGPTTFISSLPFAKTGAGRLVVDSHLRVLAPIELDVGVTHIPREKKEEEKFSILAEEKATEQPLEIVPHMYAIGDCCANPSHPLPALAQVAEQQGRYLAASLNYERYDPKEMPRKKLTPPGEFVYKSLGNMANLGGYAGILQLSRGRPGVGPLSFSGLVSWLAWRSAYLTRLGSIRKRMLVAFNWTLTLIFGRDMSRW